MSTNATKFFTASEAAKELNLDISRILQLCRAKRLGYSTAKFGKAWVITDLEIDEYRRIGALPSGRPKKSDE